MDTKIVLVTGGSRGIGADIVKSLARNGNKVILNYNTSEEQAKQIQLELKNEGKDIDIYKADVRNKQEIKNMITWCVEKYNKLDVLINNAGISQIKLFTDITEEDLENMIQTNLYGAFFATQEAVKYMINEKSGCIINISSIWGEIGGACEVHYSMAKAGLDGMTKALAKELGPSNIRVNSIAPGIINTQMNNNISQQEKNDIIEQIPLMKIGECSEISKCVEWLMNDNYTTGQVISINGGWKI